MGLFHHDDAQMQRCVKAQIFEAETSQEARSTACPPGTSPGSYLSLSPEDREERTEVYIPHQICR